ncbi:heterokaryon incompatibility protein-domain-containing protein [Xylariomycetidae sp. FL0641]|nr:heterokaryon incompatibility protein-domain-containing protein [Xylariomycetidae sp. FL0641]
MAGAWDIIPIWRRQCSQGHPKCNRDQGAGYMPDRLIAVGDPGTRSVHLVDEANKMTPQPYICLSHRWGPETQTCGLTTENFEAYQKYIPYDRLYPMIWDAIAITRQLGFRYLWVDFLCIRQNDDGDWHHQASEMAFIYSNAAITISALSCDTGPPGRRMLSRRSKIPASTSAAPGLEVATNNLPQPGLSGPSSGVFSSETSKPTRRGPLVRSKLGPSKRIPQMHLPAAGYLMRSPLLKRGWVYQERILSPRILHFTEHHVLWECNEALWWGSQTTTGEWPQEILTDRPWGQIVEEYSRTVLTKDSDRLPALSGIARRFGETHGWTYVAGLWKENLATQLLWDVPTMAQKVRLADAEQLPSWTWASFPGEVRIPGSRTRQYHASHLHHVDFLEIVSCEVELGSNAYGNPKSLLLRVEGPLISNVLETRHGIPPALRFSLPSFTSDYVIRLDYNLEVPNSGVQILAATRGRGLILKAVDAANNIYRRIGTILIGMDKEVKEEELETLFRPYVKRIELV